MDKIVSQTLSVPPAVVTAQEEICQEKEGGWRSRISFLHGANAFPHLGTKAEERGPHAQFHVETDGRGLRRKVQRDIAQGIRNSFAARPDLRTEIQFEGQKKPYVTYYRMLHNGHVPGAVISSLDRVALKLALARQMTALDGRGREKTVCFTGRPDTEDKALELVGMIFQGRLRCGEAVPKKNGVYQLRFAVHSALSLVPRSKECKMSEQEQKVLKALHGKTVLLPKPDGTMCPVRIEPIFFAKQMNFCTTLEKYLPSAWSGKDVSEALSASAEELERFLGPELTSRPEIEQLLGYLRGNLLPEETLFCQILLFKRAGIPFVIHCKSNVDRTSVAASLAFAIDQWEQEGRPMPPVPYLLLRNEAFKEVFFSHISTAHWMTFYSRGGMTEESGFGFKWHQKFRRKPLYCTQNPGMLALIPERMKRVAFPSVRQMLFLPGVALIGVRPILHNFGTWITAKDETGLARRALSIFCRAIALLPLLVKALVEGIIATLIDPRLGVAKTLYHLHPDKILPASVTLNGRPLILAKKPPLTAK